MDTRESQPEVGGSARLALRAVGYRGDATFTVACSPVEEGGAITLLGDVGLFDVVDIALFHHHPSLARVGVRAGRWLACGRRVSICRTG